MIKSHRIVLEEDKKVKETWVHASGSFDSRPLTTNAGLQPFKIQRAGRQELLDESYRLWKYDALGSNIVRTTTYFVLGRGLIYQFDDKKAQMYAKKFYTKNNLEIRLRAASDECNALGEGYIWLRPKFNEVRHNGKIIWRTGDVQVTFIPPDNITNVEVADDDAGDVYNFTYEYHENDRKPRVLTIPHISKYDFDGENNENGCLIQIKLNAGNMDPFGHSDLIPIKEWLDNYQEYLRDGVVINKLYRSPCYDISIKDGTEDEITAAIARYRGWSIGSNPVHNDREIWQVLEFTGPNSSNQEARRALLLIIAAGVGFAEFMLADGSNSNLATSKSQQLPVVKKFEDRQEIWGHYLMMMFQFALQSKALLNPSSNLEFEKDDEGDILPFSGRVEFPIIAQDRDLEVAQSNELALSKGYMSPRTAAARLNLDFDVEIDQIHKDIDSFKLVQDKLKSAGIKMQIGGANPELEMQQEKNDLEADLRKRDRSSEKGGANAPV